MKRAGSLAFILSLTLAHWGCRKQPPVPHALRAPHLVLAETRFDFGHALTHAELRHAFSLENTGEKPLSIASIEASHECSVAAQALLLDAHTRRELAVSCRPDRYGAFLSTVILRTDDPQAARVVLELTADVTPQLAWKQPVLALELQFGRDHREELELVGARAGEARLSVRDAGDAGLELAIAHDDAGDRLQVHAPGRVVGTRVGVLQVATGLDDPPNLELPFSYTVTGTLTVAPSNPYFDLLTESGRRVELTVTSSQPGFQLRAVDVLDGPFKASLVGLPSGAYHVALTFLPERVRPEQRDQRGTLGRLRLRSNDRSEPEKILTLMAFGSAR